MIISQEPILTVREITGFIAKLPDPNTYGGVKHKVDMNLGNETVPVFFDLLSVEGVGAVWVWRGGVAVTDKAI